MRIAHCYANNKKNNIIKRNDDKLIKQNNKMKTTNTLYLKITLKNTLV